MCVAGWTSSGADCEARAVAEVEDVVEQVLLRPKRDVAGASAAEAEKRRGRASAAGAEERRAGRVLLGPKRDVAGRVLLGPKRDVAGRVAVAEESRGRASCCEAQEGRGRGLSSWEEVAKKERDERAALLNGCAGGKSERERRCRESPKNKGVPKHRCGACSLSRGHQLW